MIRQAKGDLHHQAIRALGNRLVGILHGCLDTESSTTKTPPGHTDKPPSKRKPLDKMHPWGI